MEEGEMEEMRWRRLRDGNLSGAAEVGATAR
jgi:hypothetical protein